MNIDVFNEALELRNKQILCEDIMKYLSDPEAVKGMKYKDLLATFAKTFESEFMLFVYNMGVKAGMMFEDLHDCCLECECNGEESDESKNPPEDSKFHIGDRVTVTAGIHNGCTGVVDGYDDEEGIAYRVRLDKHADNPDALSMWFMEEILESSVEPETPDENGGTTETGKGE